MTEKQYRELAAVHYSLLKDFADHPSKVVDDTEKRGRGLFYGSLADVLLFAGETGFKQRYMVCDLSRPGEKMGQIIEWVIQNGDWTLMVDKSNRIQDSYFDAKCLEAANVIGWNSNWGDEARIKNIRKASLEYMEKIVEAGERIIVTSTEYRNAQELVKGFRTSPFTAKYFTSSPKVRLMTQVPVVWMHQLGNQRIKVKELVDLMLIVEDRKIILPYDVKSMGFHIGAFPWQYLKLRYYIQQSLYTEGLRAATRGDGQVFIDDDDDESATLDISGWTVKPLRFIVGSYKAPSYPVCFKTDESHVEFGRKGGVINNQEYTGWEALIKDFLWHQEQNKWDYTREVYENKGIVTIPLNINTSEE